MVPDNKSVSSIKVKIKNDISNSTQNYFTLCVKCNQYPIEIDHDRNIFCFKCGNLELSDIQLLSLNPLNKKTE